jgi:Cdc6-like AAA superfamily ATPase
MFSKTLGLSDNPFDPDFPNGPRNLAGNPLRVDQHEALEPLFCWKLGGLEAKRSQIDGLLFGPRQPIAKPASVRQGIIVIRGGRGTGKTTLASYIKRRVLKDAVQPAGNWKIHEASFPAAENPANMQVFSTKLSEVRKNIETMVGQTQESIFLLLDDLPANNLSGVINLFQDFNVHSQIYVVTTTDPTLLQSELDCSYAAKITIIETSNVNAVELHDYMADRVKLYRDPKRVEFDNVSPLFPWALSALQRLLSNQAPNQPLRMLNKQLSRDVEAQHETLLQQNPHIDITTLPQTDLPRYLIL